MLSTALNFQFLPLEEAVVVPTETVNCHSKCLGQKVLINKRKNGLYFVFSLRHSE